MDSKLREALHLKTQPVAVLKAQAAPQGAMHFKPGTTGACMIGMLEAASKGRTAAFREDTTGCNGARTGLGFAPMNKAFIVPFLSTGTEEMPGEFYKQSPALAEAYVDSIPSSAPEAYLLLKPLDQVAEDETPVSVLFLVNADQLSGLITLANYDRPTGDNVQVKFGSGCSQSVLLAMCENDGGGDKCIVGITDPSGRLHLDKNLLSFAIPWRRFLEMENNVEESFLTKPAWRQLRERIE